MSIVLAVATTEYAILKCDGRERSPDNKILTEKKKKFTTINKHLVIGFTGNSGFVSSVLDKAIEMSQILGCDSDGLTVSIFAQILQKVLLENKAIIEMSMLIRAGFALVGLEDNKIIMKSISTGDGLRIIDYSPGKKGSISYLSLVSDQAYKAKDFSQMYNKEKSIEANMDYYIKYIASLDESVNTNISTFKLKKK